MENINANLRHVANYMVQLFYQTEQQFTCTQTKIGKLLSILAFKYAVNNKKLFDSAIYRYKDCGTAIPDLLLFLKDRDVYLRSSYKDLNCKIPEDIWVTRNSMTNDPLNPGQFVYATYRDIDSLTEKLKRDIEEVFRKFGAYCQRELGYLLNSIVEHDMVVGYKNIIELDEIRKLRKEDFEKTNDLIEYLFS